MKEYTVEICGNFNVKIAVNAENPEDALEKARKILHYTVAPHEKSSFEFEEMDAEITEDFEFI